MQANHDLACIQDTACILETNSVSSTKKLRPQSSIWGPTSVQGPALCYNRYWCMIIPMCRVDPCCVHTERFSGVWRKLSALLQHGTATSDCWNRSQNSRTSIVQHSFNDSAFCDLQECCIIHVENCGMSPLPFLSPFPAQFSSVRLFWTENLGLSGTCFLRAGCLCCHPENTEHWP